MSVSLHPVTVTRRESWGPQTWLLSWKRDFSFLPGQVVSLALTEKGCQRLYSLATGNTAEDAGVLFNVVEGELTPGLAALEPGDTLFVSQPFGTFLGHAGPAVWIANGTGVAPFLSMTLSGLSADKRLIHGAREVASFFGQQIFLRGLPGAYQRCSSQEQAEGLFPGRLTAFLEEASWPGDRPYLLCGSAPMIVEVRELLFRKGVPFRNILSEVFF